MSARTVVAVGPDCALTVRLVLELIRAGVVFQRLRRLRH
jgi:hypothetical protein